MKEMKILRTALICNKCNLICEEEFCNICDDSDVETKELEDTRNEDIIKITEQLKKMDSNDDFKVSFSYFSDCPGIFKDTNMSSQEIIELLNSNDFVLNGVDSVGDPLEPCIGIGLLQGFETEEYEHKPEEKALVKGIFIFKGVKK